MNPVTLAATKDHDTFLASPFPHTHCAICRCHDDAGRAHLTSDSTAALHRRCVPQYVDLRSRLVHVARHGLRDGHYYSITLKTAFDGVIVPDASRAKHPTDITFVLQHQFERLVVTQDRFSVNLWFKGIKSRVTVPFNAITYFVDPSVNDEREFEVDMQLRTCNKPQAG
jgi:hypothetical protein